MGHPSFKSLRVFARGVRANEIRAAKRPCEVTVVSSCSLAAPGPLSSPPAETEPQRLLRRPPRAMQSLRRCAVTTLRSTRKMSSHGPPGGYFSEGTAERAGNLFGETPPALGESRKMEGWELPWCALRPRSPHARSRRTRAAGLRAPRRAPR